MGWQFARTALVAWSTASLRIACVAHVMLVLRLRWRRCGRWWRCCRRCRTTPAPPATPSALAPGAPASRAAPSRCCLLLFLFLSLQCRGIRALPKFHESQLHLGCTPCELQLDPAASSPPSVHIDTIRLVHAGGAGVAGDGHRRHGGAGGGRGGGAACGAHLCADRAGALHDYARRRHVR